MNKKILIIVLVVILVILIGVFAYQRLGGSDETTASPTVSLPGFTSAPSPTVSGSSQPSPSDTAGTVSPTPKPSTSATPGKTPTITPSPTKTPTPTPTATITPAITLTPTQTPTPTRTPTPSPTPAGVVYIVQYVVSGFTPSKITINKGDTIKFVNENTANMWVASNAHPSHTEYPTTGGCIGSTFDSCMDIPPGGSWSFTFTFPGEWRYHNHSSPAHDGKVIVNL